MSSNAILQTISYKDPDTAKPIEIKRQVEFVAIPSLKAPSIKIITNPDFDLYSIFYAQLLRIEQVKPKEPDKLFKLYLQALDEFFKLHLQAIVVTDSENLYFINEQHEKKILGHIINCHKETLKSEPSPLELKKTPLCKKALIEDNLCILQSDNILILFQKLIYDEQSERGLLNKATILIDLFNRSKKQ